MDFSFKYQDELNKLIDSEDNFEFFRNFAMEYMRFNPELFKEVFDELLIFAKANNLNKTKGWVYYYLGWYYTDITEYEKAVDTFIISKDIFDTIGYKRGLIYACNGLTNIYTQIGQFKLANEWGLNGISLAEENNDKDALGLLLINTGINYIKMKYFQKAREILKTVKMINFELTKEQQIIYAFSLAEIEINIGNPNKAIDYVEEASKLEDKLDANTCDAFKLKGMAYVKLKEYDIAEREFVKSYDVAIKLECIYEKCCVMVEWSKLCITIGRKYQAIQILKKVVEISKSKKFYTLLREANNILYLIYKILNNTKEALNYLEEYIVIDDYIYDYEQNQLMVKMNIKNTERKADLYKLLYDKTELLSTIGQKIISNLDINSIIDIISKEINKLIKTDIFGIAVYDSEKGEAVYNFSNEHSKMNSTISFKIDDDSAFGAYCIKNRKDIIIGNLPKEYMKYTNSYKYNNIFNEEQLEKSMIYTPLIINDKVVGVMTVQSYSENAYDENDLNTLKIIANYSAIAIDNAMSYKKIEEIATYDNMTGFLTRFEILRLGESIFKKYKDDYNKKFSIIMLDIDNFKLINDTYGHVYGDKAINMVTDTISKCIRTTDYIGRYGGDEFLLICPGVPIAEAIEVSERIRKTISRKRYKIGDNISISITISLGVYEFGKNDMSFFDGVKIADKYLYNAKKDSKNKVVYN